MSVGKKLDQLHVYLPVIMPGQKDNHQNYFPVKSNIPKQVSSQEELKMLTAIGVSISKSASSLLWALIILSIGINFALELLLYAFQTLQIVLAMPLLAI